MAKFKLRETEEAAIEREEEQERKFEAIVESVDAGKQQSAVQLTSSRTEPCDPCGFPARASCEGCEREGSTVPIAGGGVGGNGHSGAGFIWLDFKYGAAPKALTVGDFLDAVRKYLTEATADAPLSINGEPVRGFGVEIAVRAEQVYVDVRTREAVS